MNRRYRTAVAALICCLLGLVVLPSQAQASQSTYWWNDRVFYEVFIRSFQDSDGDGIGDIQGLISRLDYLNDGDPSTSHDLGVTGIWLMPPAEAHSYHGYDVTDCYAVEGDYPFNQFTTFLTNHDQNRLANALREDVGKNKVADSLLSHYRDMVQLRNRHSALRRGDWTHVESSARGFDAYAPVQVLNAYSTIVLAF